jgi:hypothetical protein
MGEVVDTERDLPAPDAYGPHWQCIVCGTFLEPGLANLGALRCHDCRVEGRPLDTERARRKL